MIAERTPRPHSVVAMRVYALMKGRDTKFRLPTA
jgi:hypothetical protein